MGFLLCLRLWAAEVMEGETDDTLNDNDDGRAAGCSDKTILTGRSRTMETAAACGIISVRSQPGNNVLI